MLVNRAEKELAWCDCLRQIFTLSSFVVIISDFFQTLVFKTAACKCRLRWFESFFFCVEIFQHWIIFSSIESTSGEHLLSFILHPFIFFRVLKSKRSCVTANMTLTLFSFFVTIYYSIALSFAAMTLHLVLTLRPIAKPSLEILHRGVLATP